MKEMGNLIFLNKSLNIGFSFQQQQQQQQQAAQQSKSKNAPKLSPKASPHQSNNQQSASKGSITLGTVNSNNPILIQGSTTLSPRFDGILRQTPPSGDKLGSITQGNLNNNCKFM